MPQPFPLTYKTHPLLALNSPIYRFSPFLSFSFPHEFSSTPRLFFSTPVLSYALTLPISNPRIPSFKKKKYLKKKIKKI